MKPVLFAVLFILVLCMFIIPIIPMVMCGVMKFVLCHGEYSLLKYLHIES